MTNDMSEFETNHVTVGDCRINYITAGEKGKKDLLLLHGMKFNANTWKELGTLHHLAEHGYRVYAIDLPGFGESPACEASPELVISGFMQLKGLEKPVLAGPSMSGKICLEFCRNHQDLLGGLVLLGSVGVRENSDILDRISLSTLILWGENDTVSPLSNAHLLKTKIRNSSLTIIRGAGHPCYLDSPTLWHQKLVHFLKQLN